MRLICPGARSSPQTASFSGFTWGLPVGDGARACYHGEKNDEPGEGFMTPDERREVAEAVAAGRRALASLEEAADALDSASNWGLFDLVAGGLLSSLVKHARLGDARDSLERARADLYAFTRELSDVRGIEELRVDVGGLAATVDVLLDNPFVDLYVQKKISDAEDNVAAAIAATKTVLARLEAAR